MVSKAFTRLRRTVLMRVALSLFGAVLAAIVAFWWWLGLPVAMPVSPLAAGEKLPCASYAPFRTETSFGEFTPPVTAATLAPAAHAQLNVVASAVSELDTVLALVRFRFVAEAISPPLLFTSALA